MQTIIVGAGPTGLVAALVLTLNGVDCRVIEKRPEHGRSSRALGLQARSMEVLAGLDVARRVEPIAYQLRGAAIMKGNDKLVELPWVPPRSRYPYTYVVPQSGLEEILRQRLGELGVEIERGREVTGLRLSASGATVKLADGEALEAEWVIGADGARSRVREAAGIPFPQRATGEAYHLADATIDLSVDLGDSAMWLGAEGPLMLMRLPGAGRLWRVFIDMSDADRDRELAPVTRIGLENLLAARGPQGSKVESLHWTSVFRTRMGLASSYRAGRVFIAGDAAHVFPPFGGQGMNLGIQDAVNLAWRIAGVAHGAPESLLNDYEPERRPVAASTIRDVEARRRLYALRNPLARAARDALLRAGGGSRGAARRASLQNSQLMTTYQRSVSGRARGPAPRPGDRLPDGRIGARTLHDLIAPDHATVLIFDPEAGASTLDQQPGVWTAVVADADVDGALRRDLGLRTGERRSIVVRPDGHVGFRGADPFDARAAAFALVGRRGDGLAP